MNCRIVAKPGFTVIGQTKQFTNEDGSNFKLIPVWWNKFLNSPDFEKLTALSNRQPGKVTGGAMLGVDFGSPDSAEFSYGIGIEIEPHISSELFVKMNIASATWAIFDCTMDKIQETYRYIFNEWFPMSPFKHDAVPHMEVYLPEKPNEQMKSELWIPVIKNAG